MKLCDLHTHSVYSDGTWTPKQLLDEAERIGLGALVLSDHNTVAGLPDFMAEADGREILAIPGVEFSTDFEGKELHILGLFVKPEYFDDITALLDAAQKQKEESNIELIENLNRAGYALDYARIQAATQGGQFNRAHVAAELVRQGYVADRQEAFDRLLSPKCGYYHPPKRMSAFEAIEYIHSIGAVSVLAHPLLTLEEGRLRTFLDRAAPLGLDGMETIYSTYDSETRALADRIADAYGLLRSGGSDFHGDNKPDIMLGTGRGNVAVPVEFAYRLRECCQ